MAYMTVGNTVYGKPNMAALEGELGRRIMSTILSTPKPDFTQLDKECAEVKARMNEARANGTF